LGLRWLQLPWRRATALFLTVLALAIALAAPTVAEPATAVALAAAWDMPDHHYP
jgi:hypothetical protein